MTARNTWAGFAARRVGRLAFSMWVLVTASFLMIHLVPGDPVRAALGHDGAAELVDAQRRRSASTTRCWLQYVHYLRDLLHRRPRHVDRLRPARSRR